MGPKSWAQLAVPTSEANIRPAKQPSGSREETTARTNHALASAQDPETRLQTLLETVRFCSKPDEITTTARL
ncbi:hypothetical protein AAFF_G00159080 [Aldrovandia affinis]|uniref:Uncharacterized protein n=1 Tax=Aldrovandia affinis TaxID=143900 RepID=A0AAD7R0J5_9TELE|nr:hypothetical protein AAFF_G00159080 [Aldrovandia affinis]